MIDCYFSDREFRSPRRTSFNSANRIVGFEEGTSSVFGNEILGLPAVGFEASLLCLTLDIFSS